MDQGHVVQLATTRYLFAQEGQFYKCSIEVALDRIIFQARRYGVLYRMGPRMITLERRLGARNRDDVIKRSLSFRNKIDACMDII